MIPQHDIFESPEFWWEKMFLPGVFLSLFGVTLPEAWEIYLVFGSEFFNFKIHPLMYFSAHYIGMNIPYMCIYVFWTLYLGNNFPMPYGTFCCSEISVIILLIAIWCGFPREVRSQPDFTKRRKFYFIYWGICTTALVFVEPAMTRTFHYLKIYEHDNGIKVTWILAFIIPICRGFYEWILPKILNKAAGHANEDAIFWMDTFIACAFALYATVMLADANDATEYLMLGVEMGINFCYAFQFISMHNKIQGNMTDEESTIWKNKKQAILRSLVTMETIEVLIPLAYGMCYATAYFGPNSTIMRDVKNTYWGNTEMDITGLFWSVSRMALIDACGGIVIGALLWLLCRINFFEEFCNIMAKYWISISIAMGSCMFYVRNKF